MLQLLSLLQQRRYWSGAELTRRLGVSARTLRRDVERLRELGYPVETGRGVGGGYQLVAGAALPPLVLDDEEAVAIAVGLQTAAQSAVSGIEESSVRALTKVVQVMPSRLRQRVDALQTMTIPSSRTRGGHAATVDPATLTILAQACRDDERLRFNYTAPGSEAKGRYVEPHRLVCLGRRWYLVAYDLTRHDWRSFRLDRLAEAERTGSSFRTRQLPAADAAAFVQSRIENLPNRYVVDIVVHASAAIVRAEVDHWGTIEDIDDHQCQLRMTVETFDWPAMLLGAIGADFDIISPPEFTEYIREWADRFARATNPRH
ncbi:YafY family protein [Arthrobacter pigmenti]